MQGRVKERFLDKNGSQLVFGIENGFYKNNLTNRKCVDKRKGECYFITRVFLALSFYEC